MSNQPLEAMRALLATPNQLLKGTVVGIDRDDAVVSTRDGTRRVSAGALKVGQSVLLDGDRVRKVIGSTATLPEYNL